VDLLDNNALQDLALLVLNDLALLLLEGVGVHMGVFGGKTADIFFDFVE